MNKKFLLFLIAIAIALSYLFSFEKTIYQELLNLSSKIQKIYLNAFIYTNEAFNKYINQLDYIEQLKKQNKENLHYKLLYGQKENEYNELVNHLEKKSFDENNLIKVKVVSYYQISDYSKVIIDKQPSDEEKIKALITYDGFSAGIVVNKNAQSIGYLNQNKKCNYTVFIGDENSPGITSGVDYLGRIIIKYVPIWKKVNIDDEVITSSMDSIFPFGIKVGKVEEVKKDENIQEVYVRPYANTLGNREYYLYEKKEMIQKEEATANKQLE